MKILYVAGPMTGLPDFNYPAFRKAAQQLRAAGYGVRNPTEVAVPKGFTPSWEWYMRRTLKMMLDADGIAVLPGWRKSRGASIEVDTGDRIGIPSATVSVWLAGDILADGTEDA